MKPLLEIEGLRAGYGAAVVLEAVDLAVGEGDSLALLGRNGAGKSTLITTILGLNEQFAGQVRWRGASLAGVPSHRRARAGLGWVPQERLVWPSLTVDENLAVVARTGPWTRARIHDLFPRLRERRRNFGNQLSGGEQQMLAIARALATNPALLLLDEPMEGLAPLIVRELMLALRRLIDEDGLAVIVVEQHARLALSLTRQAVVLERGRVVHAGDSAALLTQPALLERFLAVA
jgi:branched-chain amino acid transport system ATP-binding protein